jgi:hypothetical protein
MVGLTHSNKTHLNMHRIILINIYVVETGVRTKTQTNNLLNAYIIMKFARKIEFNNEKPVKLKKKKKCQLPHTYKYIYV